MVYINYKPYLKGMFFSWRSGIIVYMCIYIFIQIVHVYMYILKLIMSIIYVCISTHIYAHVCPI